MRSCAAHGMLLRVTPSIPGSLYGGVNQLQPLIFCRAVGRGWQREHLPPPLVADHRHDRLTSGPPDVSIGARVLGVGSHKALLHGEDEIVSSSQGGRRKRGIVSAQSDLKSADRLAEWVRRFDAVIEMQRFDLVKQRVGLREEGSSARLAGRFLSGS
jgi:hypothetical protein